MQGENTPVIVGHRVTSYDVAEYAGVSQSAVSRCFKPGASVSKKMRDKVMDAVEKLGYQPNAIARGLITNRSNMVAVIIANLRFYPELLAELSKRLSAIGQHVLLFSIDHESDANHIIQQIWQYRVDGVIAAAHLAPEHIEVFRQARIPIVFINRSYRDLPVSSVSCDQVAGERALVDLLVGAGHKSFGIIAGPRDSVVSQQRTTGAIDRLKELGIEQYCLVAGDYDYDSGKRALHKLEAKLGKIPDAIICANDVMAVGCIDEARLHFKLHVPDDLAVVGYDGVSQAMWANYDLVTVRQPIDVMADATISLVMERVNNPELPPENRMFLGTVLKGSSAGIDWQN